MVINNKLPLSYNHHLKKMSYKLTNPGKPNSDKIPTEKKINTDSKNSNKITYLSKNTTPPPMN